MTRASAKAEAAQPSQRTVSPPEPFSTGWPMAGIGTNGKTVIESIWRMSELQMELGRFAADCARRNASTMAALTTCRSPADFIDLWRQTTVEVVTDYAEEAARLLERAQK